MKNLINGTIASQEEVNIKKAYKIYNAFFIDAPYRRKWIDLEISDKVGNYKKATGKSLMESYAEVCNIKKEVKTILIILEFMDRNYYTDRIYFELDKDNYVVTAPRWGYDGISYVDTDYLFFFDEEGNFIRKEEFNCNNDDSDLAYL